MRIRNRILQTPLMLLGVKTVTFFAKIAMKKPLIFSEKANKKADVFAIKNRPTTCINALKKDCAKRILEFKTNPGKILYRQAF